MRDSLQHPAQAQINVPLAEYSSSSRDDLDMRMKQAVNLLT